ncbi:MAG: putative porin, partial [Prevotella sp.]
MKKFLSVFFLLLITTISSAQTFDETNEMGGLMMQDENRNKNFNKHNNDTTSNKEIPTGLYVWTIDSKFGDITPATPDTMPHLYMNSIFNTGLFGQYNTTGNNYTARENRIVIDRPLTKQFFFNQPYSWVMKATDSLHFTNTLSPLTNISYDNCGDKTNGEDHIDAKFAINAGKKLGMGFDLNYAYARGYYSNQSASHFGATLFASYLGDRYKMHAIMTTYHQKVAENGGITDDYYITHPESFEDSFSENEIPTVLNKNWNRNNQFGFFLTHRYSLGFYRMVKMTEEEIKAKQFAKESKREKEALENEESGESITSTGRPDNAKIAKGNTPSGRPEGAKIMGDEPKNILHDEFQDSTRIKIDTQAIDSLKAAEALQDSIDETMKREFVPVTSFIHTIDYQTNDRIYQAYDSPENYYANTFYNENADMSYPGDSIYDKIRYQQVKNTLAIALLEGFNKYAKAGLKVFASHEYRKIEMPDIMDGTGGMRAWQAKWNEHAVSIGGQI